MRARALALALGALAAALLLAACGSGGSSGAGGGSSAASGGGNGSTAQSGQGGKADATGQAGSETNSEPSPGPPASAFHPKPHHDSGGGAAQFEVKGADNSVQEFGSEASESEMQAAAAALHGFLDARTERNWAAACGYLSRPTRQGIEGLGGSGGSQSCAAALGALSANVPRSNLREAAIADVGALRSEGDRAFLIYRGAEEVVYAIAMSREGGEWKVGSLAGVPLS